MDAVCPRRLYPALVAQCAGRIVKGDHYDPIEFVAVVLQYLAGASPFGLSDRVVALDQTWFSQSFAILAAPNSGGHLDQRGWTLGADKTDPRKPVAVYIDRTAATVRYWDLRTMTEWDAIVTPPTVIPRTVAHCFLGAGPDAFGSPWLNPI